MIFSAVAVAVADAALALLCTPTPTCGGAVTVNCATPTPVIRWDAVVGADLAGYRLYIRDNGGPLVRVAELPCEWLDLNDDGVFDTRICRGVDFGIPIQRHCATCAPISLYEFSVKAYDLFGVESVAYSDAISVCMPPVCDVVGRGVCN